MTTDLWLPKGYEVADGSKVRSLQFSGDDWQVFETNGSDNLLLFSPELFRKWSDTDLLDESLFGEVTFGKRTFYSLFGHKKYVLSPVDGGRSPDTKVDAMAFSLALKTSRGLLPDATFHDAIYVEQFSRLLPTWTLTPYVGDKVVLGAWLTGGVVVSTDSFRRITSLAGWMPAKDLAEIITAAGFHVPADAGLFVNRKPASSSKNETRTDSIDISIEAEQSQRIGGQGKTRDFSLPGRPRIEEFFNEHVVDIIFNSEKYHAMGIEFPSAIVLHGPPGCGKTFAVERLVDFIDWPSYSIDSNSVGSPYIHETSKKISEIFDKAIDSAPAIIVIDEMESFLSDRQSGGSSNLHHVEEVAEFLRRIPEAIKSKVLIIAMTNLIDMIDPAILRRGRFDHVIEVGMPSRIEVASLLESLLSKLPKASDLDMDKLLDTLTGKALSDSAFVVREAARLAAKAGKSKLDQASIDGALQGLPEDRDKNNRRIGFDLDS